jgi:glycosyltransferase involved in cell wall biosynthesis
MTPSVIVAQMGARRHYAIPISFQHVGRLRHFYTDLWAGKGPLAWCRHLASQLPLDGLKKWAGRFDSRLPNDKVTAFTRFGLEYVRRLRVARTATERTRTHLWAGETFGLHVVRCGFDGASAVYGIHGGAKTIFEAAREKDLRTALDQTSCPQLYQRLEREERERWPGWEAEGDRDDYAHAAFEWENAELALASVVLCPSPFVRDHIRSLGISDEKARVVPYAIPIERFVRECRSPLGDRPLRVLFVGRVSLMKGVPYLLEALRVLNTSKIEARLVGAVAIGDKALAPYRGYCEIVGPVPRSEIVQHYRWADLFVFPSICEGSAIVVYEALGAGLPVICTPNAGSVVRDGQDGFVIPIRDAAGLAEKIETLLRFPDRIAALSESAVRRAQEFSWEAYGRRLVSAIEDSQNG